MDEAGQFDGVPSQLGDYRLLGRIGEGGMGTVYEAIQGRLDRRVALKVLAPRLARDEVFLGRFRREALAAAGINHPNLIQVYDIGEEAGFHFYVMEFVAGENVGQRIKRDGALPLNEGIAVAAAVAAALAEVHERGIVHRDIKPENIMIDTRGHVKLADLGLAKCLADETAMTLTGTGMGSPHFMAPEQARDAGHVDRRADIYALGITLLTMLTGKRPYQSTSPYMLVQAHAEAPLPSGEDLGTPLPPAVEKLVASMAAKDPDSRLPDCRQVGAGLREILGDQSVSIRPARDVTKLRELGRALAGAETNGRATAVSTVAGSRSAALEPPTGSVSARWWLWITGGIGFAAVLAGLLLPEPDSKPSRQAGETTGAAAPGSFRSDELAAEELTEDQLLELLLGPSPSNRPAGGIRARRVGVPPAIKGVLVPDRALTGKRYHLPTGNPVMLSQLNQGRGRTPDELWTDAESFARDRPTEYRGILARYLAVHQSTQAVKMRLEAARRLEHFAAEFERACRREIETYSLEMKLLLEEGKAQAAYDLWRAYPRPLLIFKHEPVIYDIIRTNMPADRLPPEFGVEELAVPPARAGVFPQARVVKPPLQ